LRARRNYNNDRDIFLLADLNHPEWATELTEIAERDRDILSDNIDDLAKDTPQTQVAALIFKRIVCKLPKESAYAFQEIVVDIIGEPAKKAIFGQ
jgi:hypothetical protein